MIASLLLFAAIAQMIAKQSIPPNAASAMAAEKSTKKHLTSGMKGKSANGSRLCAGGDLEHESFNSAQKPNRITTAEFSNSAPLAQNRC